MSTTPSPSELSFDRATPLNSPPPPDACAFCQRGLSGEYYRVAGRLACATCAAQAAAATPVDTHKAFVRALLFGSGAAIAGCIGYALFGILTGITLGYAAIGVGYLIGRAMNKGSGGIGGRRYQIVAAILTYAAVSVAFVPMAIHEHNAAKNHPKTSLNAAQQSEANDAQAADSDAAHATGKNAEQTKVGFGTFLLSVGMLLGIGLVSPFLILMSSIPQGLLNLFIVYLGIQFAWRATARKAIPVDGPYSSPNA